MSAGRCQHIDKKTPSGGLPGGASPSPYAESPAPGSLMGRTRLIQLAALRARLQLALRSPGSASDDEQPDPARDRRSAGCRDQDSEEPGQLAARSVTRLDRPDRKSVG